MVPERKKIRVLAHADARIFSGAESLFSDVVAGLAADDRLDVVAAAPPDNAELGEALERATGTRPLEVASQPLRLAALHLYDPRRIRASRKAVRAADPDVIFLNLPSPEYGTTPLLAGTARIAPTLGLVHITAGMKEHGFRLGGTRQALSRRALRRMDRVCLVSRTAADTFTEQWGSRDAHPAVIRLREPSVAPRSKDESRRALALDPEETVIGIAGRLTTKQKGHDTLIEASRILVGERPGIRFVAAGDGPDLELLRALADSAGVGGNWNFPGAIRPLDDFYGAIDLIAIPSRFEGLPLVALEAIEAGRPGVASAVDGLADVWPDEWQVPPDDPGSLARRISNLLDSSDEELEQGLQEARRRMADHVTPEPADDVRAVLTDMVAHA